MNSIGVCTLVIYVIGEYFLNSSTLSNGAPSNHVGWNNVKSAVYHQFDQPEISRCDPAALNRVVCVPVQSVSNPPPLPPVTPIFPGSTYPNFTTASTQSIKS